MPKPRIPKDQMSPYDNMEFGKLKLPLPQEICEVGGVQGCGNPNCDICMPKSDPGMAGGALRGGPPSGSLGITFEMMRIARDQMRMIDSTFLYGSSANPTPPKRSEFENKEQELRPKVERFFLKTSHSVAWDDVIGNETAKQSLLEAIEYPVIHKELFAHYKKKPTKGVLLYGPPGCGKTMFGKAAACALAKLHGKADAITMMSVKGPEIQSPYVGITEGIIRDIFAYARVWRKINGYPMLVFIDEADAILPSRDGSGTRRALPWEESNVATFLTEMDGLDDFGALVVLATNRPHQIDSAILRDGRIDRKIKVERPNEAAAAHILLSGFCGAPVIVGHDGIELAAHALELLLAEEHRVLRLRSEGGRIDFIRLSDILTGAMLVGVVERAKATAFHRDLAAGGRPTGISPADVKTAVLAVYRENLGLNHAYAVNEFAERFGIKGGEIEPIQADTAR